MVINSYFSDPLLVKEGNKTTSEQQNNKIERYKNTSFSTDKGEKEVLSKRAQL